MDQPVGTTNVNAGDPVGVRVATTNDLRRILSKSSGVDVLLALKGKPAMTRVVDLLQTEVCSAKLHSNLSEYLEDCAVCLEALVIKHHALPASLLAFHKEALLWTQLSHPNLLSLIGVNTTVFPHGFCLVSPWITNGDIISFLERSSDHDRLAAIMEISAGITYLHDSAIVHGDIKGANVLMDEPGQCRLADFGLAFTVSESTTLVQSCTSDVKGSIRWMAPELFRFSDGSRQDTEDGKERMNKFGRDIYAFACTILEIITGKPPFADRMPSDVMVILEVGTRNSRPPRPLPEIYWCPDNVWALVQQCWAEQSQDLPKASEVYGFLLKLVSLRHAGAQWEDVYL
ncbi:MAP kinase kinase kinase activity protein [Marasmius tenuissimus]|nr:MAP kinase kinase kinase activity protein [Marasmius tenuissimus]